MLHWGVVDGQGACPSIEVEKHPGGGGLAAKSSSVGQDGAAAGKKGSVSHAHLLPTSRGSFCPNHLPRRPRVTDRAPVSEGVSTGCRTPQGGSIDHS